MTKVIHMFSGLSDVEATGNQSLKNGIRFLSEFGYRVRVFTFMPDTYPNLQDPSEVFGGRVEFHRLPDLLAPMLGLGRRLKDSFGRRGEEEPGGKGQDRPPGGYLREYSRLGRTFYLIFLFALYLPVELTRGLVYSLRQKPDLIYGVNCQGAVVAGILGRILRKPVITRFHGVMVSEDDLSAWDRRLFVLDETAGLRARTDAVVVADDGTGGDRILKLLKVDGDKVRFWMNGLDTGHLRLPAGWDRAGFRKGLGLEGRKVILMVSRLASWKRVDRGIRCMHGLIRGCGVTDAALLIAGDGPERRRLEELARELGVDGSVRFLGWVPNRETARYYSIADVFLSLYDMSNLGNPLLEAMYSGLPIVTMDDGSAGRLLKDNYNCLLVNPGRVDEELPRKVQKLLTYGPMRETLGRNARKAFNENVLSWQERMRLEDELIKGILCNRETR